MVTSRRHRSWTPASEVVMKRYCELCIDLRTPRMVKDGLISYKNSTLNVRRHAPRRLSPALPHPPHSYHGLYPCAAGFPGCLPRRGTHAHPRWDPLAAAAAAAVLFSRGVWGPGRTPIWSGHAGRGARLRWRGVLPFPRLPLLGPPRARGEPESGLTQGPSFAA